MYYAHPIYDNMIVDKIDISKFNGLNYACIIVMRLYIYHLNMSQKDIAKALNIEEKSYSKSLNRNSTISAVRILKFCKFLKIDSSEYFYNVEVINKILSENKSPKQIEFKCFKK